MLKHTEVPEKALDTLVLPKLISRKEI